MNSEEEKLCLKWNDFQENAISAFGTLRNDREFADVTLACEDGQQVEAHKVILASSSLILLSLLRNNHPHPLIYLKGIKKKYQILWPWPPRPPEEKNVIPKLMRKIFYSSFKQ